MVRITAYKEEYKQKLSDFVNKELGKNVSDGLSSDLNNLSEPSEYLICFDENENVLGYSKTTALLSGIVKVDNIYVSKDFRRDKNGSLIMVAIMQRAVNRLIAALICECNNDNTIALSFFKALGFTINDERNNIIYLSKSLLYMYKVKPEKE